MPEPAPTPHPLPQSRWLIDALNVAYWCGSPPSLVLPIALLAQLLRAGCNAQMVFDASARYQLAGETVIYTQLIQRPTWAIEVPSGRTADGVMLRQARTSGGGILSRDRFRDHRRRFRKLIDDPTRLVAGHVTDETLIIPLLSLHAPLPRSTRDALAELEALMHADADTATPSPSCA